MAPNIVPSKRVPSPPAKTTPTRVVPDRIDPIKISAPTSSKPAGSAGTVDAKLKAAVKPAKPSTPAGTGMYWAYNSSTNKWVKTKNKTSTAPSTGGPSFEFGGLPSLDLSNIDFGNITLPGVGTEIPGSSGAPVVSPPVVDTTLADRQARADQLAREGLSASSAAVLAGLSGQDLADITIAERSGNFELANSLQEAALGRRQAQLASRAEQTRSAYEGAMSRQRAGADLAAQGFVGPVGVGAYQRLVAERNTSQQMAENEMRLAAALSAFERMKQQAQARRDAAQANLLSRINPVASFTRGNQ